MIVWALILLLVAALLLAGRFVFGLGKGMLSALAAVLFVGLAGYALQGSPGLPGISREGRITDEPDDGTLMIALRRQMMAEDAAAVSSMLAAADRLAQAGKSQEAAAMLLKAVRARPDDAEAWVALGNALVADAEGNLTPPAMFAFRRAEAIAPESPAAPFFVGFAEVRAGRLAEARDYWRQAEERLRGDSPMAAELARRLEVIDMLLDAAERQTGETR